ncbi:hypothetical protein [Candidatus Enterovibrio escicola]
MNGNRVNPGRRNGVSGENFILLVCLIMKLLLHKLATVSVGDNEVLPILLNPLRQKIQKVSANGAYDIRACHHVLKNK